MPWKNIYHLTIFCKLKLTLDLDNRRLGDLYIRLGLFPGKNCEFRKLSKCRDIWPKSSKWNSHNSTYSELSATIKYGVQFFPYIWPQDWTASLWRCSQKTWKLTSSVKMMSEPGATSWAELYVADGFSLANKNLACKEGYIKCGGEINKNEAHQIGNI